MEKLTAWVRNYEGLYKVNTNGLITSLKIYFDINPNGKPIKVHYRKNSTVVYLIKEGNIKIFKIADIVYTTFNNTEISNDEEIIYIDGDISNNKLNNLKLVKKKKKIKKKPGRPKKNKLNKIKIKKYKPKKIKKKPYKYTLHIDDNNTKKQYNFYTMRDVSEFISVRSEKLKEILVKGEEMQIITKKNL